MNPGRMWKNLDWAPLLAALMLVLLGLVTMKSFGQGGDYFFTRQIIWALAGLLAFFISAIFIDWSFLKTNSIFLLMLYLGFGFGKIFFQKTCGECQNRTSFYFVRLCGCANGAGDAAAGSWIGYCFGGNLAGPGFSRRNKNAPSHFFIFSACAEEWGFVGVLFLLLFFGTIIWRILRTGIYGESNFEKLYAAGLAILLLFQSAIHIGMNSGVLPITGLGMPFLSYGGSSLVSFFLALGILESFSLRKKGIFIGTEDRFKEGILGT